jgi:hypothetical protein
METMKTKYIIFAAAAVLSVGCNKSNIDQPLSGDAIRFGASYRTEVFTKAGSQVGTSNYDEGTSYLLFAVGSQAAAADYNWVSENGFQNAPQTGTESDLHAISYEPVANFRPGNLLDFYALTYGNTTTPALDADLADGVTPTITIAEASDRLPDLMHSNEVKDRTAAHGQILLPFDHATAALNFLVSKQDETEDPEANHQLNNVKLTGITIQNVAESATMDLVSGQWTWAAANVGSRVAFPTASATTFDIPVNAEPVGDTDILIFPNDDGNDNNNAFDPASLYKYQDPANDGSTNKGEQIIVSVGLSGIEDWDVAAGAHVPFNGTLVDGTVVTDGACTIHYPMRLYNDTDGSDAGPLHFLRNKRYTLSIVVMRNNVRIVAVSPQVYDWVNVDIFPSTNEVPLGQPITIGTTVWMDRNLGASSADCENEWLDTVGYYWEFGRNIPFMVDWEIFRNNQYNVPAQYKDKNGTLQSNSTRALVCDPSGKIVSPTQVGGKWVFQDNFMYTFDQYGRKYSEVIHKTLKDIKGNGTGPDGDYAAINPGDNGTYAFLHYIPSNSSVSYWYYAGQHDFTTNYWKTVSNQPVPKGWRLPTAKDVYTIMPEDTFNWTVTSNRFMSKGVANGPTHTSESGDASCREYADSYYYQFFYGNVAVNPNASASANLSTPTRLPVNETRVYGIKYQGTSKAYRYMIEMRKGKKDGAFDKTYYARFSFYPATKDDKFTQSGTASSVTQWNLHKFDWDHPSSVIDFPMSGQMYSYIADNAHWTLNLFGIQLKIRLDIPHSNQTYCMKLSNDGTGVHGTFMATTVPTRLVRDVNVND